MKKIYNNLINESYKRSWNKYLTLTQVRQITMVSKRTMQYRMKLVKEKYENTPKLLSKEGGKWKIHQNLVKEFHPKYNLRSKNMYTQDWKSRGNLTITGGYDLAYHWQIMTEVKEMLKGKVFIVSVEQGRKGDLHSHLMSGHDPITVRNVVESIVGKYIENWWEWELFVLPADDKYAALDYMIKAIQRGTIVDSAGITTEFDNSLNCLNTNNNIKHLLKQLK